MFLDHGLIFSLAFHLPVIHTILVRAWNRVQQERIKPPLFLTNKMIDEQVIFKKAKLTIKKRVILQWLLRCEGQ